MANSCFKCQMPDSFGEFDFPKTPFNFLEGDPWICEKCLAEFFGLEDARWKKEIIDRIQVHA